MRFCSSCKETKEDAFFGKDPRCKLCNTNRTKGRYWENPEKMRRKAMERFLNNRDEIIAYNKRHAQELRRKAFEAYGGCVCKCCGETEFLFLTIDHVNGGGNEHRRNETGGGQYIARWLRNNNYPGGFQVLCYNCNCGRSKNNNICPHESNTKETTK